MAKNNKGVAEAARASTVTEERSDLETTFDNTTSGTEPGEGSDTGEGKAEGITEDALQNTAQVNPNVQGTAAVVEEEVVGVSLVKPKGAPLTSLEDVSNAMLDDAAEDLGFQKGDVALPFMRVLQSNSPQVKKQNAKYVEGAEEGFFFNAATSRAYDGQKGIYAIPVHFTKQATLWIPRTADGQQGGPTGGGFVREVPMTEAEELLKVCTKNDKKKDITPANYKGPQGEPNGGMELVIAALYYLLLMNDWENPEAGFEPVAYPLTSTQMKKARTWNALIQNSRLPNPNGFGSFRPAMFGYVYKLTTVPESNAQGEWMGLKVSQVAPLIKHVNGVPTETFPGAAQLYIAARDFKQLVGQGQVTTKAETLRDDDGGDMSGGGEGSGGGGGEGDEPLPF